MSIYVSTYWGKADLHIHSNKSDGTASIEEIMGYVQDETDLDVIAITDHNTIEGALAARSMCDSGAYRFDVIVGEEITTTDGHILGLFLTEHVPARMTTVETIRMIERQGGIAVVAHPFSNQGVFGPFGRNRFQEAVNDWAFHALETYNSLPFLVWANSVAAKLFAGGQGIAATGGSDAHFLQAVGTGFTRFRGRTAQEVKASILAFETRAESKRHGLSFAWRLARNIPQVFRLRAWNRQRCKGDATYRENWSA